MASNAETVRILVHARQPTIQRSEASTKRAICSQPRQAETSAKSNTHNRLGISAQRHRLTLSSGHDITLSRIVVNPPCCDARLGCPACVSVATPCRVPPVRSRYRLRQILSASGACRLTRHARWISGSSAALRFSRALRRSGSHGRAGCLPYADGAICEIRHIGSTPCLTRCLSKNPLGT